MDTGLESLLKELATAKKDLDFANQQFDETSDAKAIDEIIFRIIAAEKKFDRLYQLAKECNVTEADLKRLWPGTEFFDGNSLSL